MLCCNENFGRGLHFSAENHSISLFLISPTECGILFIGHRADMHTIEMWIRLRSSWNSSRISLPVPQSRRLRQSSILQRLRSIPARFCLSASAMTRARGIPVSSNRSKNNEQHTIPEGAEPSGFFVFVNERSLPMQVLRFESGCIPFRGNHFRGNSRGNSP